MRKIEEVARAICRVDLLNIAMEDNITLSPNGLDAAVNKEWPLAVPNAIAAIKAMREPTVEMEVSGTEAWACEAAMEDRAGANYRAMIDHALWDGQRTLDLSADRLAINPPASPE
jgi:hypothetical protein